MLPGNPPSTQEGGGAASTTPTNNANMPRVDLPVRADTGVCRRLDDKRPYTYPRAQVHVDLFPSLARAQWRREKNPVRRFGVISNNPQSHHHRSRNTELLQPFRGQVAIIPNNELRVRVYRRYGRDATVRDPVRQLCGSTPFTCARCQESASCPLRQRGPKTFSRFAAARPRLATLETPLLPTWLRAWRSS